MDAISLDHVQIAMPPEGEGEARQFFGELLGLREIPKPEPLSGRGGCWFQLGGKQLHLGVERDFRPARKAHIAVCVADLAALRAKLEAAGYATDDDVPLEGRSRFFSVDPFGNRMEFVEA